MPLLRQDLLAVGMPLGVRKKWVLLFASVERALFMRLSDAIWSKAAKLGKTYSPGALSLSTGRSSSPKPTNFKTKYLGQPTSDLDF